MKDRPRPAAVTQVENPEELGADLAAADPYQSGRDKSDARNLQ